MRDSILETYQNKNKLAEQLKEEDIVLQKQIDMIHTLAKDYQHELLDEARINYYTSTLHLSSRLFRAINFGEEDIKIYETNNRDLETIVEQKIWQTLQALGYEVYFSEDQGSCWISFKLTVKITDKVIKQLDHFLKHKK